jgi:PleD family two-component response regulator
VLGLLSLDKTEPGFYTLEMAERLAAFAAQAGLPMENARLYAEQQRSAVTDSLTGMANRRYFDQELARELLRASRFNCCTALAELLGRHVRSIDTAARYGGEEFVVILPESN